jgi:nicotinate-nucleotide adenylyltransferase
LTTPTTQRTALRHQPRRIALFGGSFDPIHSGHLTVACAADRRFNFDEVHFVVAGRPPHKLDEQLAPFPHRFAMVALACAEHPHFVPSLAEAGEDASGQQLFYSIDTVRHFKRVYHGSGDRLYFILGADAFLELPLWREYETLLGLCDFIVASRPGIRAEALRLVIPPELLGRPPLKPAEDIPDAPVIAQLRRTTVHLLEALSSDVSSTDVRRRAHRGQAIHGLVSARVEEYILKQGLYR